MGTTTAKKSKGKKKTTKPLISKGAKIGWILFLVFLVSIPLYVLSVNNDLFGLFGGMPSVKALENPQSEVASELFTADNVLLGKYFLPESNRTPAQYDDLSPHLVNALIAIEDVRFDQHSGIDAKGIMRAIFGVITFSPRGGGSTLSQQLAKNLFGTRTTEYDGTLLTKIGNQNIKKLIQKSKEWIIAVELEKNFTKQEILAMYLNTVDFGGNNFGINVAARTFFNTTPDSLNIQQAAVLAGLVQRPTALHPVNHNELSKQKRNLVLGQMLKYEYIDQSTFDSLKLLPLETDYKVQNQNVGLATYFRTVTGNYLRDWATENNYDLYSGGLKIYTTIDSKMQEYAEQAVADQMKALQAKFIKHLDGRDPWIDENDLVIRNFAETSIKRTRLYRDLVEKYGVDSDSVQIVLDLKKPIKVFSWDGEIDTVMSSMDSLKYYKHFLQTGFMAMDPGTGYIKAWVGGIDHKYFKFDHVKQGRRQPGSTFKPFVYATAIDQGYSPCYQLLDAQVTFDIANGQKWTPQNSNGKFSGETMTIRQAMANSVNSITAKMMEKVRPEEVVKTANRMGIESKLDPVMALSLGVSDVSLFELVGAYSTFVNKGTHITPFFITRIEDKNGNILQEFPPQTKEALSEQTAYLMIHMLKGAVEEKGGAGWGLSAAVRTDNEIGAKTGTTQNASDGWFMGITHNLVAGAWVGGDDRSIHFRDWGSGQGARTARPIWNSFMEKVYSDQSLGIEKGRFPRPIRGLSVEINCDEYSNFLNQSDSLSIDSLDQTRPEDIL